MVSKKDPVHYQKPGLRVLVTSSLIPETNGGTPKPPGKYLEYSLCKSLFSNTLPTLL